MNIKRTGAHQIRKKTKQDKGKKRDKVQARPKMSGWTVAVIGMAALLIMAAVFSLRLFQVEMTKPESVSGVFQSQPSPLELEIREMTKGYPIEDMAPYIARNDRQVAAFLVSIAKKESDWGKRVPHLNGRDCYNYWGYRGKSEEMGTGGHTCFKTRKEAVQTVAKRIKILSQENKLDTPPEMIVWKCGYDCSGHSQESVQKWISDVSFYFRKFAIKKE